jgi:hypothetical protein
MACLQATSTPGLLSARACRIAYATCYLLMLLSGKSAARLAADFRTLGAAGRQFGPLTVVLQLPVLACWLLVRPISLAAFAGCCALAPRLERA